MPYRNFAEQEFYHIFNHSLDDKIIFQESQDYHKFISFLEEFNDSNNVDLFNRKIAIKNNWKINKKEPLVNILAYTILPKHFHIFFQAKDNKKSSLFLQKISGTYTRLFNKKYNRKGPIFLSKTKSIHIQNKKHFLYITYYIHLNILDLNNKKWRKESVFLSQNEQKFLYFYPWSSLNYYILRKENPVLNTDLINELFPFKEEYKKELEILLGKPDFPSGMVL